MSQFNDHHSVACRPLKPPLKWPGGKAWLAPVLAAAFNHELRGNYYEPFAGAVAVFCQLCPRSALLSDINVDLMNFYECLKRDPDALIAAVRKYKNTSACYYSVRSTKPRSKVGAAARFLYLNRTCWGGVYRLNREGEFNVPFGNSGRAICRYENLIQAYEALRNAKLTCDDFERVMDGARSGDVIYADPPYTTLGEGNGFLRYNERLFGWKDQERLAATCQRAADRGVFVAVSGLWHDDVLGLFPHWWALKLERHSLISREVYGRRKIHEVVLFSKRPHLKEVATGLSRSRNSLIELRGT